MTTTDSTKKPNEVPADLKRVIDLALDRKGVDMTLLDLHGVSNATDYFLLVNGTSDTHVRSIADHIEGLRSGRWVLIDFIDFVVHVFHPTAREFYQLERLWGDAPAHPIESPA